MYGDNVSIPAASANAFLAVTKTQYRFLKQWVEGEFIADWDPSFQPPKSIGDIHGPQAQAEAINQASLWFCLGGPFHPGCEMTWPMRYTTLYESAFRIRLRTAGNPEPDYGDTLSPDVATGPGGPLYFNGPGDISRWMAVPWQTDTASCRAGYDQAYDPWLPTFWPARVPNHVLTLKDYEMVIDPHLPRQERLEAFNRRAVWYRILGDGYLNQITNMVGHFGDLGVVEYRPGVKESPDFPDQMFVETPPGPIPDKGLHPDRIGPRRLVVQRADPGGTARDGLFLRRRYQKRPSGANPGWLSETAQPHPPREGQA